MDNVVCLFEGDLPIEVNLYVQLMLKFLQEYKMIFDETQGDKTLEDKFFEYEVTRRTHNHS